MKKLLIIAAKTLIPVLYCLVVSFHAGDFVQASPLSGDADPGHKSSYSAFVPVNFFDQAIHSESQTQLLSNVPVFTCKKLFCDAAICTRLTEQNICAPFMKYIVVYSNDIIKYQATDIIYPYHFFW